MEIKAKTVFFSWITDNWINTYVDFDGFYNSFKKFHPDIHLVIFKNDKIYLDEKPMRSYHVAYGHGIKQRLPQLFSSEICEWFNKKIYE